MLGIIINRVILPWMTGEYSFSRLRKIRRRSVRDQGSERGRGTTKQPVFWILCRNGTVWAEIVDVVGSDTLQSLISQKVSASSIVRSDTWKAYTVCPLFRQSRQKQYSDGKGDHINGREGFRVYLKRKLVSKYRIRREKFLPYLGEYVGRYNHRNENDNFNVKHIIKLPEHTV